MFELLSNEIVVYLATRMLLDCENARVYFYSVEVLLMNLVLLLTIIGVTIAGSCPLLLLGYIIFYIPIRIFAGGYHAKNSDRCYVLSVLLYVLLACIYNIVPNLYASDKAVITCVISIIGIAVAAPHTNENHELSREQYLRNKKIVLGILLGNGVAFALLYLLKCRLASSIVIYMATCFIMIWVDLIRLKLKAIVASWEEY